MDSGKFKGKYGKELRCPNSLGKYGISYILDFSKRLLQDVRLLMSTSMGVDNLRGCHWSGSTL